MGGFCQEGAPEVPAATAVSKWAAAFHQREGSGIHFRHGKTSPWRGYIYIGAASFLWAVSATLGRAAFTGSLLPGGESIGEIGPLILAQARNTVAFLALVMILGMRRGWRSLWMPRGETVKLFLLGVLGISASSFFYYVAIQRTNVAMAIMLQYTAPIWVLVYLSARWWRKPTLQQASGVVLAMAGIVLLLDLFGAGRFRLDQVGVAAGIASAFAFAFYNIGAHGVLRRYDRWTVILYVTGGATLFWLVVHPPWAIAAERYSGMQWVFLVVFAVVSALAPFVLYAAGLEHLEPPRAMIGACMEPVFSIALAAVVLGELLRPMQLVGVVVVLAAIVAVEWPSRKRMFAEAVMEPIE